MGAEATTEAACELAEVEQWIKSEWYFIFFSRVRSLVRSHKKSLRFKLHLRSNVGSGRNVGKDIPPLPLNKSVVDVFADFLDYLFRCAMDYIKETHASGPTFWESVKNDIDFVLSHPNGWEGAQQQEMRKAAVIAKLIPDTTNGHARLSFVTEGEASLHFSIQNGLPPGAMKVN